MSSAEWWHIRLTEPSHHEDGWWVLFEDENGELLGDVQLPKHIADRIVADHNSRAPDAETLRGLVEVAKKALNDIALELVPINEEYAAKAAVMATDALRHMAALARNGVQEEA